MAFWLKHCTVDQKITVPLVAEIYLTLTSFSFVFVSPGELAS